MQTKYITIEREYGSGGTFIAQTLSQQTGIPCYGKEIIETVSEKWNVSIDDIQSYEEKVTNGIIYSLYMLSSSAIRNEGVTKEGRIYLAEQETIRSFADKSSAIFLGHCASEALKEKQGVVKVFVHCSDIKAKQDRIAEYYHVPATEIEKNRKRYDKKRSNYYYANTSQQWNDYKNYDIVLDSAKLGINGCVAVLKGLFE